jgi:hypothetical protein
MIEYFNLQTHNDRWVVDLFKSKRGGYFVEAGALDGIHGSCTYTLEKYLGWRGLLVEPGVPFTALKTNRPGSVCENVCLAGKNGPVEFVEASDSGYSGIKEKLVQLDLENRARWGKPKDEWQTAGYREKIIPALTFAELLKKHAAPPEIEYVAFDMEGAEYDVLKDFPFQEYRILAFSIEGDSCNDLLLGKGFRLVKNPFNTAAPWEYYFLHPGFRPPA